jgi:hybrid cluster-associated redox disulfide protein
MSGANADKAIRLQDPVSVVLARSPAVVAVFVRHRMACPGCAMAPYMTIGEAAQIYGLDPVLLVQELEAAAGDFEG